MTLHAFTEYLKYKWRAKGLHGTHSPFVYDLIEQVLLSHRPIAKVIVYPSLPLRYENLISRTAAYYNYNDILYLPADNNHTQSQADLLLLNESARQQWSSLLTENAYRISNSSAVIATHIHSTAAHTAAWQQLCAHPQVRMSIDLYGIGMLFFKEEFKEPQHFILKY